MASVNQSIGFLEDSLVNSECVRDEQHNERVSHMIQPTGPKAFKADRIGDRTLYNWADGGTAVLTTLEGLDSEYVLFTPLNIMSPSSVEMMSAMYDFSQEVPHFRTGGARWDFPGSSVNAGELFAIVNEVDLRVNIFRVDGILDSETGRRVHWDIFGHSTRNVAVLSPYMDACRWYTSEAQHEISEASREIRVAQQQLRGASKNSDFETTLKAKLKAARKKRSSARWRALEKFFEGYVRQLEKKSREGDQAGFYRHLKMIDVEASHRPPVTPTMISSARFTNVST
ncbi:unnamed protein product [Ectocarpus sp. CCAP 1310/34]|nr:unnamed protein product [Ectocarpus sp. CCAP 1310/34]